MSYHAWLKQIQGTWIKIGLECGNCLAHGHTGSIRAASEIQIFQNIDIYSFFYPYCYLFYKHCRYVAIKKASWTFKILFSIEL